MRSKDLMSNPCVVGRMRFLSDWSDVIATPETFERRGIRPTSLLPMVWIRFDLVCAAHFS
jgi:hypothetical protein